MNNKNMRNVFFSCLSFELTRRCNMNCSFCARGNAQDVDITTEIIDKALEEVDGALIDQIRLNGGEPFLNPEMIEYLISSIVERKVKVCNLVVFTNGSVLDDKIKNALEKMADYLGEHGNKYLKEYKKLKKRYHFIHSSAYKELKTSYKRCGVYLIWSNDQEHKKSRDDVENPAKFYGSNKIQVIDQNISTEGNLDIITLEGRALSNHKEMFEKYSFFRRINNRFCLINLNFPIAFYKHGYLQ